MQLKVAAITNLTDARFFNAIGANYLGFNFDALDINSVTLEKAKEIVGWLFEPILVGEFGQHQTKEEIAFIAEQMEINEIQLPFRHPEKEGLNFEKFLVLEDWHSVCEQHFSDILIVSISPDQIEDAALQQLIANNRVFIEMDFTNVTLRSVVENLQPYGIQITCRKEEKPGLSLVDEYADMLEEIGFS